MQELKDMGLVQKIGASLYSPPELDHLLEKYTPDIIQAPINIFDQRMIQNGHLKHLNGLGVEIHSRSVFLQGLLLMHPDELPNYFQSVYPLLLKYRKNLQAIRRSSLEAALYFVNQQKEINHIIVGINNKEHIKEIVQIINRRDSFNGVDFSEYAISNASIIDPSLWRLE